MITAPHRTAASVRDVRPGHLGGILEIVGKHLASVESVGTIDRAAAPPVRAATCRRPNGNPHHAQTFTLLVTLVPVLLAGCTAPPCRRRTDDLGRRMQDETYEIKGKPETGGGVQAGFGGPAERSTREVWRPRHSGQPDPLPLSHPPPLLPERHDLLGPGICPRHLHGAAPRPHARVREPLRAQPERWQSGRPAGQWPLEPPGRRLGSFNPG